MMKNISFFALSILLSVSVLRAQDGIGYWNCHTPCGTIKKVDVTPKKVFAATQYDIFSYNPDDNAIERFTKVSGMSDFEIGTLKYNAATDMLFVGYVSGNIDIIDSDGTIFNIPDIKEKNILGSKRINEVFFSGEKAYVCCSFGIVVVNLSRMEVSDTYFLGDDDSYLNINDLTVDNNKIYVATNAGVFYADANCTQLADFNQWHRDTLINNPYGNFSQIEVFEGKILANFSLDVEGCDTIYAFNGSDWKYFARNHHHIHNELRACTDKLVVSDNDAVRIFDKDGNLVKHCAGKGFNVNSAVYDASRSCYWFGDSSNGLFRGTADFDDFDMIYISSPYTNDAFALASSGEELWIAAGGYLGTWEKLYNHAGAFHLHDDEWHNLNNLDVFDSITDVVCVAVDPSDSRRVYLGSFSHGIIELYDEKVVNVYERHNSTLTPVTGWDAYVFVSGLAFDKKHNLWAVNCEVEKLLSMKSDKGVWTSYNVGPGAGFTGKLVIDRNDYKWIHMRDGSFIVFDGTKYKKVSTSEGHGGLPGTGNCCAVDGRGTVWIGTSDGMAEFTNSSKIFGNNAYNASRILVPRNDGSGQADYLLSGVNIKCLAIDGADNLWCGTNNGVFCISNDGLTEHHHFTTENSPIFSNNVSDIAVTADGTVYFATDKGVISYRGRASEGKNSNSNVFVYPNPVKHDYNGPVGIKNLVKNSLVKITTVNGDFVTHLRSEGGQAVWDCTTIDGKRVDAGVYLIFICDEKGNSSYATKILVL